MKTKNATSDSRALGLIAGSGRFPSLVLEGARRAGVRVVVVGLRGCYDAELREAAARGRGALRGASHAIVGRHGGRPLQDQAGTFYEAGIARLGRWIRIFRHEGVHEAIMAGQVRKATMLALPRWRQWLAYLPDWTSIKVWYFKTADRRNDTLLRAVADEMARKGIELVDSTKYCPECMASEGTLTRRALSAAESADAELGWRVAREMGRLDVGQSVAIKDGDIIAVEAIEGTNRMIARAGELCPKGGWVLVKVAKPKQDMRFDVPTVGPETIERLAAASASALVVEAGKTLMIDRARLVEAADRCGIAVVGRRLSDTQSHNGV